MTDSSAVPALPDGYEIEVRKVPRSSRTDWTVARLDAATPADSPEFVGALRQFFAEFDAEIERRKHDPIATGQALAKLEVIAADVRHLVNELKRVTAQSMSIGEIRRIVVEGVGVLEASSSIERKDWQHGKMLADYLAALGYIKVVHQTGEVEDITRIADWIACLYGPSASPRMTPLKEAGLDPDRYCTIERDENDKPVRTPSVRVAVNELRRDGRLS